ncbi:acyltransferase family protein [Morganella morganii]|uniref:acyltransferase family protein n=1 Tax=Morganella morganii TaxID=582 RepID=UPI0034E41626
MLKYRKELDGLRALAVIPVVIYHAKIELFGVRLFSGGFFGVDVFFVLSGFLITSILIGELSENKFSLISFYERRARRIMPALFTVMIACVIFSYYLLFPDALSSFYESLIAVSLFVSNIFFSLDSNYFSPNVDLKPLLHTWSLAVEEQYYLVFPILLAFIWRFGKKTTTTVLLIIFSISILYASHESITDKTFSFYSIFTRAWELLIGSLSAIFMSVNNNIKKKSLTKNALSLIGLSTIICSLTFIDNTFTHPSWITLLPTIGSALVIIFSSQENIVGKLLSFRLFVFIGVLSYSIYLWHHPIFAFARNYYINEPSRFVMLMLILLTVFLSYISWKFIESPFRSKSKVSRNTIFSITISVSIIFILIGLLGSKSNLISNVNTSNAKYNEQLTFRLRGNYGLNKECEKSFNDNPSCQVGKNPEIILWGDSFAMHLAKGITASNHDVEMIQATVSQCAPILGIASTSNVFGAKNCIDSNYRVIEKIRNTKSIKHVVIASPFLQMVNDDMYLLNDGDILKLNGNEVFSYFLETIETLKDLGVKVTVVAPPPEGGFEIGMCLHKIKLTNQPKETCNFPLTQMPEKQKELYKLIGSLESSVNVIWLSDGICRNGQCSTSDGDIMIYRDYGHLSHEGSEDIGQKMNLYKLIVE